MGVFDGLVHAAGAVGRGASRAFDQVNTLDNGRTWQNPQGNAPQQKARGIAPPSAFQQAAHNANVGAQASAYGITRSLTGVVQGASGIYDLASPGAGTSRTSKALDGFAQRTDNLNKQYGSQGVYKAAQGITDAGTFLVPGGAYAKAAQIPKVIESANAIKAIAPIARAAGRLEQGGTALSRVTGALEKNGFAGKVGSSIIKNATSVPNAANALGGTAMQLGSEASKGRDISPKSAATALALNSVAGVALPVAGTIVHEGAKVGAAKAGTAIKDGIHSYAENHPIAPVSADYNPKVPKLTEPTVGSGPATTPPAKVSNEAVVTKSTPVAKDVVPYTNDSADAYVAAKTKAAEAARTAGQPSGIVAKAAEAKQKLKTKLVDKFAAIEDPIRQAAKKDGVKINPLHNIVHQIDNILRADTISGQYIKDSGIEQLLKDMKNKKTQDTFDQYAVAKRNVHTLQDTTSKKTGRSLAEDQALVKHIEANRQDIVDLHKRYIDIKNKVLDASHHGIREGEAYHLTSKDSIDHYKRSDPYHTPYDRIFSDTEHLGSHNFGGGTTLSVSESGIKKFKGSSREIDSPSHTLLTHTAEMIKRGERNRGARILAETMHLPSNPLAVRALRTAAKVTKRIDVYSKAKDLRPVQNKIERTLKTNGKAARKLATELNNLNIKGYNYRLKDTTDKTMPKFTPSGLGGEVPTSKAGTSRGTDFVVNEQGVARGNDAAKIARNGKAQTEAKAEADRLLGPKTGKGLIPTGEGTAAARKAYAAGQRNKDIITKRGSAQDQPVHESKLGPQDTKALLNHLVNADDATIKAIRAKILNREPKLKALLDEIEGHRIEVKLIKQQRAQLIQEGRQAADLKSSSGNTFSAMNNGIKEIYEAGPAAIQAIKNLSPEQISLLGNIARSATRLLKLGATGINLGFATINLPRDILSAMVNSEHPFRTSIGNPNVLVAALKASFVHRSKEYGELVRHGAGGTSFDQFRGAEKRSVERIMSERNVGTRLAYAARHPIHTAEDLLKAVENTVGRSEEFTRALQYYGTKEAKLKAGFNPAEARALAAHAARNNTTNFSRSGEIGKVLNTVFPYLNAGIQGSRTLVRNIKERPVQTGAAIAVTALLPMAVTTAYNLSDPKRRAIYNQLSEQDKRASFIIVTDKAKRDPKTGLITGVIRIPISQEVGNLTRIVGQGIESMKDDKNFDWKAMTADMFATTTSLQAKSVTDAQNQLTPQYLKPALETTMNKNFFTGQQVVPDAMKNIDKKDQYNANSSSTAMLLGKTFDLSPLALDNFFKTGTAGGGQNALNFIDQALAKAGLAEPGHVGGKDLRHSVTDRFGTARSQSDGGIYFQSLQDTAKKYKLAGRDYELLNALSAKEVDGNGKPKLVDDNTAFTANAILAHSPDVARIKAEAARVAAKATGKPLDPLYNLNDKQLQAYYTIHSTPRGSADYLDLYNKNKDWLNPLNTARADFFTANPIKGSDGKAIANSKVPYPVQDDSAAATQDQYFALTDPAEKSAFLKANPGITDNWNKKAAYTNQVRQATNYSPLVERPMASPEVQALLDAKNFKDPAAQAYLNASNLYNINKKGGLANIAGNEVTQSELKAISGLGKYGMVKNPDGTLAVAGSPQEQAGAVSTKGFGGGHHGGRRKGITKVKNLRSPRIAGLKAPSTHIASYTAKVGKVPRYKPYNLKLAKLNKPRKRVIA